MSKVVKVETLVNIYITVPDEADKQAVYNFCANNLSYMDAFLGAADDTMRVTDVIVVDEEVEMDWDEGNPVWQAYDGICPDCGEDIDTGVVAGDECPNCGHVFHEITEND